MTKGTNSTLSALLHKNKITKNRNAREAEKKSSEKVVKSPEKVVKSPEKVVKSPEKVVKSYHQINLINNSNLESLLKLKKSTQSKVVEEKHKKINLNQIKLNASDMQSSLKQSINTKCQPKMTVLKNKSMNIANLKNMSPLNMLKYKSDKKLNKSSKLKATDPTKPIDDQIIDLSNQIQTTPAINWTGQFDQFTSYNINDGYNRNGIDTVVTDKVYTADTSRDHSNYSSTTGDTISSNYNYGIYTQLAVNKLNNDVYLITGTVDNNIINKNIYKFSDGIISTYMTTNSAVRGITIINNRLYYLKEGYSNIFVYHLDNGSQNIISNNLFNVTNDSITSMTGNNTHLFIAHRTYYINNIVSIYRVNLATDSISYITEFIHQSGGFNCVLDTNNNLYFCTDNIVKKIVYNNNNDTYSNNFIIIIDEYTDYTFNYGADGTSTYIRTPLMKSISIDEHNYMYLIDYYSAIIRIDLNNLNNNPSLTYKRKIVGEPEQFSHNDNSNPDEIRFNLTIKIAVKNQDKIYVIDWTGLRTLTIAQIFDQNVETPLSQLGMLGVAVLSTQLANINTVINNDNIVDVENAITNANNLNNNKLANYDSSHTDVLDKITFAHAEPYSNVIDPYKILDNGNPLPIEATDVNDSNVYFMQKIDVSETYKLVDPNDFVTYPYISFIGDQLADTLHKATSDINNIKNITIIDHPSPTIIYDISNVTLLSFINGDVTVFSGSINDLSSLVNGYLMEGNLFKASNSSSAVQNDFRYTVDLVNNVNILEMYDGSLWSIVTKDQLEITDYSQDYTLVFNNAIVMMPASIQSTPNNNNVRFNTVAINLSSELIYRVTLNDTNVILIETSSNANILIPNGHASISIMSNLSGYYYLDENNSNVYYYNDNSAYLVLDTAANNNYYNYNASNNYGEKYIATLDSSNNVVLNYDILYVLDFGFGTYVISNQYDLAYTYFIVSDNSNNILYKTTYSSLLIDEFSESAIYQFSDSSDLYSLTLNNGGASYFDKIGYVMSLSTPPDAIEYYYSGTNLYDRNNNMITNTKIILDLDGVVTPLQIDNNGTTHLYYNICIINGSQLFSLYYKNQPGYYNWWNGRFFDNINNKYIKNKSDFLILQNTGSNGYIDFIEQQNPSNKYILDTTYKRIYQTDSYGKIISEHLSDASALTNAGTKIVIYDGNGSYIPYIMFIFGNYNTPTPQSSNTYVYMEDGSTIYLGIQVPNLNNIIIKPSWNTYGPDGYAGGLANLFLAILDENENYVVNYFNRSDNKLIPYWSPELLQVLGEKPTNYIDYDDLSLWKIDSTVDTDNKGVISPYSNGVYALHNDTNTSIVTTLLIDKPSLFNGVVQSFPLVFIVNNNYNGPIESGLLINLNYVGAPTVQYRYLTAYLGQTTSTNYNEDRIIAYGTYTDNSGTYNNVLVYYDVTTLTFSKDDSRVANKYYLGMYDVLYKSQASSGLLDYEVEDLAWLTFDSSSNLNNRQPVLFSESGAVDMSNMEGTMIYVESSNAADSNHNPAQNGLKMYAASGNSNIIWRAVSGSA
jgi:hypothetical protein